MAISRHRLAWWIVVVLFAGLLYLNAKAFPWLSSCWFKNNFGFECTGCGSQRSIEALLTKGDLMSALSHNALTVVAFITIVIYIISSVIDARSTDQLVSQLLDKSWFKWGVLSVVVGYTVIKNLLK